MFQKPTIFYQYISIRQIIKKNMKRQHNFIFFNIHRGMYAILSKTHIIQILLSV
jgi:hypothetical protein